MSREESISEASARLLSTDGKGDIYEPAHRHGILSHALSAALTVVNIVALLATASIWLSFFSDNATRFLDSVEQVTCWMRFDRTRLNTKSEVTAGPWSMMQSLEKQ
jgi:hypothetical protein